MKRICSVLLAIAMCFSLPPLSIIANADPVHGLFYEISNGEVTITDCQTGEDGDLVIPDTYKGYPVTAIGDNAFSSCSALDSIVIPEGVTYIGDNAFSSCIQLKEISIPTTLKNIGKWAFSHCVSLKEVTIPDGVVSIGTLAFSECRGIVSMTLPASVTQLGDGVFVSCDSLTGIQVAEENPVFANDSQGVLYRKDGTAVLCAPRLLTGSYVVPDGVTTIAKHAFYRSLLSEISIPDSVLYIGTSAFEECSNLKTNVYGNGEYLGNGENPYVALIKKTPMGISELEIPAQTKVIGAYALSNCTGLTAVELPEGLHGIGAGAFSNCSKLKNITLPENLSYIGAYAFQSCNRIAELTVPESVQWIGNDAFSNCRALKSINIPEGITTIGDKTFYNCLNITEITIPSSVTHIGAQAFSGCSKLDVIYLGCDVPAFGDSAVFQGVTATAYYHAGSDEWADVDYYDITGEAGKIVFQKVDHLMTEYRYDYNHTCTANGTQSRTCHYCGITETKVVTGTAAHEYTDGVCTVCGQEEFKAGDLTGDGKINIADVSKLYAHVKGTLIITDDDLLLRADLTGDGKINIADVSCIYAIVKTD